MIVVVGSPVHRRSLGDGPSSVAGPGPAIARSAAVAGSAVQLVGKVGTDPVGDATLLALVRDGVGHAAMLRDPSHPTPVAAPAEPDDDPFEGDGSRLTAGPTVRPLPMDAEDLELALRYLGTFAVLVMAEVIDQAGLAVATEAARYAGASLLIVLPDGAAALDLPAEAIVLGAPPADEDGIFAQTVGTCAAALDRGLSPVDALRATLAAAGWESASASNGPAPVSSARRAG